MLPLHNNFMISTVVHLAYFFPSKKNPADMYKELAMGYIHCHHLSQRATEIE